MQIVGAVMPGVVLRALLVLAQPAPSGAVEALTAGPATRRRRRHRPGGRPLELAIGERLFLETRLRALLLRERRRRRQPAA